VSKQSNMQVNKLRSFFNSNALWATLAVLLVCGVVTLFVIGVNTGDPLKNAYNKLPLPKDWQQTKYSAQDGPQCSLSDVPCPARHYTYSAKDPASLDKDITKISGTLVSQGYKIEDQCLSSACGNDFITAHNSDSKVTVRVSAQESGNGDYVIQLDIENY
jgi:hypothetical protein